MAKLSENAQAVLSYLQEHDGENLTHKDISEALGLSPRSVTGTVTGLQKKNFATRIVSEDNDKIKFIKATVDGLNFNVTDDIPVAE